MIGWILWYFRRPSDLHKALDEYLKTVQADAPIRRVIESAEVQKALAAFDSADWKALRKQASYRRASHLGIWAGFVGAIVPALGLISTGTLPKGATDAMNVLRILSTILTSLAIMWLSLRQSGARWFEARSNAETARAKVFDSIVNAGIASKGLLPQAFACFQSAHLNWQLDYFASAVTRHGTAAQKIRRYRLVGRTLLGISAALGLLAVVHLAGALGYTFPLLSTVLPWMPAPSAERWNEGLSAMASSILAFTSERTAMDRDTRNAAYYELAASNLEALAKAEMQKVLEAADNGDDGTVANFCKRVQDILDAEHRVWSTDRP